MRTALILSLLCPAAWAQFFQNSDFSTLVGGVSTSGVAVATASGSTGTVAGSVAYLVQSSFGYQFVSTAAGSLYVEGPLTYVFGANKTTAGQTIPSPSRNTWYFTPGARFKFLTGTRVSFYGALGAGAARFTERDYTINGALTATADTSFHPALDFAAGVDLRLVRFMSLRAEARDFITAPGLGGTAGYNHPVFLAGIAFHD